MTKPIFNLSLFPSPERLKNVKDERRDLSWWQIASINQRKNTVNGRYVAALNLKAAIFDMYPNILSSMQPKKPNARPMQQLPTKAAQTVETPAPEVAPPPVIPTITQNEVTPAVLDQYRKKIELPTSAAVTINEKPAPVTTSNEETDRLAFIKASQEKVLQSYAAGTLKANTTQSITKEASVLTGPGAKELTDVR